MGEVRMLLKHTLCLPDLRTADQTDWGPCEHSVAAFQGSSQACGLFSDCQHLRLEERGSKHDFFIQSDLVLMTLNTLTSRSQ